MWEVGLMAGFDVFICGAFEEFEEAHVAGIVTDMHSKTRSDSVRSPR